MGNRVTADVKLWNFLEESAIRDGSRRPVELNVKVDPGSFLTILPESLVNQLGLQRSQKRRKVTFADGRSVIRDVALGLRVEVLGRDTECEALIEPGRDSMLLGLGVLEALDLFVDTDRKVLFVRHCSLDVPVSAG